jgi:Ser/Thr protein kinase RdoA (MazF antagonist)
VQTSTHALTIGEREVRKEFVTDHEEQAEREWASPVLLAEHAPDVPVEVVREALGVARAYVAAPPVPQPRFTALGLADLNPANVLWDGRTARLVDFEDGGHSDPAYELADHVEHTSAVGCPARRRAGAARRGRPRRRRARADGGLI